MTAPPIIPTVARVSESTAQRTKPHGPAMVDHFFSSVLDCFSEESQSLWTDDSIEIAEDLAPETEQDRLPDVLCSAAICALMADQKELTPSTEMLQSAGGPHSVGRVHLPAPEQVFRFEENTLANTYGLTPSHDHDDRRVVELQIELITEEDSTSVFTRNIVTPESETTSSEQNCSRAGHEIQGQSDNTAVVLPITVLDENSEYEPSPAIQILSQISDALTPNPGQATTTTVVRPTSPFYTPISRPSELKLLRFRLQPEDLGDVEVTLRRTGIETKVTIAVAGRAAVEALGRDMGILEDRLGGLLAPGAANAVTVSMEVREPELQRQFAEPWGGQGTSDFAHSGGHGFGRDGRSEPRGNDMQTGVNRNELNEEDSAARLSAGNRRIV